MKFSELEVHPDLIKATQDMGFENLTPIQEQSLEPGLNGRDIAGIAQTGTGKTVAFLLPILHKIFSEEKSTGPVALVVSPTRELCLQIAEEAEKLCAHHPVEVAAIYGGEEYHKQERRLENDPAIIVATPGRLMDFMKQRKIATNGIQFLVLDEADRMLDMGFIRDIRWIMKHVPDEAQTFLFSATMSYYILRLASDFMQDPVEVRIEAESVAVDKIDQHLFHLSRDEKNAYMVNQMLAAENMRGIVFSNYKHAVKRIVKLLQRYGIAATGISSLLDQKKRVRLLKKFKQGEYTVLVATDVASRGLDVDDITHVFNYDLPQDAESYVHRIGRTARAGKEGISFTYCSEDDYENLPRIQRYIDQKIPVSEINIDYLKLPEGEFEVFKDSERLDEAASGGGGRGGRGRREGHGGRGGRDNRDNRGGRDGRGSRSGRGKGGDRSRDDRAAVAVAGENPVSDIDLNDPNLTVRERDRLEVMQRMQQKQTGGSSGSSEGGEGRRRRRGGRGGRGRKDNEGRRDNEGRKGNQGPENRDDQSSRGSKKAGPVKQKSGGSGRKRRNDRDRDEERDDGEQSRGRNRNRNGGGGNRGGRNQSRAGSDRSRKQGNRDKNSNRNNTDNQSAAKPAKKGILAKIKSVFKRGS